jgi:hypothetical protein
LGKRRARRSRKIPEGPPEETPPQKRSPAVPASTNGANSNAKSRNRKSTSAKPSAQEPEQHFYWIADGQTNIGFVEQVGGADAAFDNDERRLGAFPTLEQAADAVSSAAEVAR